MSQFYITKKDIERRKAELEVAMKQENEFREKEIAFLKEHGQPGLEDIIKQRLYPITDLLDYAIYDGMNREMHAAWDSAGEDI